MNKKLNLLQYKKLKVQLCFIFKGKSCLRGGRLSIDGPDLGRVLQKATRSALSCPSFLCFFGTSLNYHKPLLDVLRPAFNSRLKGEMANRIHWPMTADPDDGLGPNE